MVSFIIAQVHQWYKYSHTSQILETLKLETKVKQYEGDAAASGDASDKLDEAGKGPEIGNLKRKLQHRDEEIEKLKQQLKDLNRDHRELTDKYSNTNPDSTPKKDK